MSPAASSRKPEADRDRRTRIVERDEERHAITEAVRSAASGRGTVLLIEGEGGIGKTRLLDVATADADAHGLALLRAAGHELEQDVPFAGVRDLFEGALDGLTPHERTAVLSGAASGAGPLVGGLHPPGDPQVMVHGLFWLTANLAEHRPLVIAVDDAHVADEPTLRFVAALARRCPDLPVALVVATRNVEAGPRHNWLRAVGALPHVQRLRPAPLTPHGTGWMLADAGLAGADSRFVAACAEATGGNPLYVRELAAVLVKRGIDPTGEHLDAVHAVAPQAVAESIHLALVRMPPSATAMIRSIAVLTRAHLGPAAALAGLDVRAAEEAALALESSGLLHTDGDLRLAHPVVRTAIYEDLRPLERRVAHARAARLLHRAGSIADVVAEHLLRAEPTAEDWATNALEDAAVRAQAAGDADRATRLLRAALDARGSRSPERARLLARLADAEAATGALDADARYEEAATATEDPVARARIMHRLGRTLAGRGRLVHAATAFERALGELSGYQGGPDGLEADIRADLAGAHLWTAPDSGAFDRASATITNLRAPRTLAERSAVATLAGATALRGLDRGEAVRLALLAWGDGALMAAGGPDDASVYSVTVTLLAAGAYDELSRVYDALLERGRQRGQAPAVAALLYARSVQALGRGALLDAEADVLLALELDQTDTAQWTSAALWVLSNVYLARGRIDEAAAVLDLSPGREAGLSTGVHYTTLRLARAQVHLARGDHDVALTEALESGARADRFRDVPWIFSWRPAAVAALAASGHTDQASVLAAEELSAARRWGAPAATAAALLAHAPLVETAAHVPMLEDAVANASRGGARVLEARALLALGQAKFRLNEADPAGDAWRRALDLADLASADGLARTARERLAVVGSHPRNARSVGAAALTPGELRVVRLATAGRTNREIAEALFVTVKAVKWHLSNAYRKLGVSSRGELAAALVADLRTDRVG